MTDEEDETTTGVGGKMELFVGLIVKVVTLLLGIGGGNVRGVKAGGLLSSFNIDCLRFSLVTSIDDLVFLGGDFDDEAIELLSWVAAREVFKSIEDAPALDDLELTEGIDELVRLMELEVFIFCRSMI